MRQSGKLVLFDHQIFSYQQYGGVSRYFVELMKHIDFELWDTSFIISNNEYIKEIGKKFSYINFFKNLPFYKRERLMLELGKPYSLYKIRKEDYGVLHLTHYESYANLFTKRPVVMTYHDKLFSSYCYNKRTIKEQKKCFTRADKIITISNNTKNDLISLFDIDNKKIEVIYHGINKDKYIPKERIIKEKYILFVGMRNGYKNFSRLLEVYAEIVKKDMPELSLVCTGNSFGNDEMRKIERFGIKKEQISSKFYCDEELQNLYQNAELFIFPSEYEGFGLPLLEAMKNNCPIVCSNTSSMPEIAEDAAEYFNPLDVNDMFAAVKKILFSYEAREKLVEKGKQRCESFSWGKSAQKHIDLYKSLI